MKNIIKLAAVGLFSTLIIACGGESMRYDATGNPTGGIDPVEYPESPIVGETPQTNAGRGGSASTGGKGGSSSTPEGKGGTGNVDNGEAGEAQAAGKGGSGGQEATVETPVLISPTNGQVLKNFPRTLDVVWTGNAERHQVEIICWSGCWPVVGIDQNMARIETEEFANSVSVTITGDDYMHVRVRAILGENVYGEWSNEVGFQFQTGETGEQKKLVIEFNGPDAGTIYTGGQDQVLFLASFTAPISDIWVDEIPFTLSCSDELTYRGSNGTDYITDIKIKDVDTGATVMGPTALPKAPAELQDLPVRLLDSFLIKKGETRKLAFTVDIAVTEDVAGELIGKTCHITLADWATIQAEDATLTENPFLTVDEIEPNTEIVGNVREIKRYVCPNCPIGPQPDRCATFMGVVGSENGGETRFFATRTILSFSLNADSPSGTIGDGLQKVITVNARAGCGDAILTKVRFQTTTDGDDIGWMLAAHENRVVSAVSYDYDGTYFFDAYGEGSERSTETSVTGLYWDHEFPQPILIEEGETFTFSLSVTFGGPVVPPGTFSFNMMSQMSWYGTDNPDDYPDVIYSGTVFGNELSYAP